MPRKGFAPALIFSVVPLCLILLALFGPLASDTIYTHSGLGFDLRPGLLPGGTAIDPNVGITSYSLGALAARDVLSGRLPLWDYDEGLGAPLLGSPQAAALFPPTVLLALPHGQQIEYALLQFIAALGTYLAFRRFGLGALAAVAGAILFELNGVFAWMRHAPMNPTPFLPWLIYAVECARAPAGGIVQRLQPVAIGAIALALSIYAGFPEVAYLNGLFVGFWALWRLTGMARADAVRFFVDLGGMVVLGLLIAAPALVAFADFLPDAYLSTHGGSAFYGVWEPPGIFVQYLLPYLYGPLFAWGDGTVNGMWGSTGGYLGLLPLIAAVAVLFIPARRGAKITLAVWIVIALGASHGWPVIYRAFMALPLTRIAACFRYLNASWIFCFTFLAAMLIDEIETRKLPLRKTTIAIATAAGCIAIGLHDAWPVLGPLWSTFPPAFEYFALALVTATLLAVAFIAASRSQRAAQLIAAALVGEALIWFAVPYLSYPRVGKLDTGAITFLQSHVGLQRAVDAFGPLARGIFPNYGAALGIALLNYDNLPVPERTLDYVKTNLEQHADRIFAPRVPELPPDEERARADEFRRRLPAYANAGVKYVLAAPDFDLGLPPVLETGLMKIYELPGTRPYFTADGCTLLPLSHARVEAYCSRRSHLVRLELYMRGWSARVNGIATPVTSADKAFQSVQLPPGRSVVTFAFVPPGFTLATVAALIALVCIACVAALAARQSSAVTSKAAGGSPLSHVSIMRA